MLTLVLLSGVPLKAMALAPQEDQTATQGSYEYQDRIIVQQTVEDVMARPEFQRLHERERRDREESQNPAWLERLLDWLKELFSREPDSRPDNVDVGAGWIYGIAFLIVVGALAFIVKSVLDSVNEKELAIEHEQARIARGGAAPGETPPEEYWARARALAAAGNEKLALRELLLGAMSALERQGFIRYRRGLTNRDYFWAATGDARESLRTLIAAFERVYFGRREVTTASYRECSHAYLKSFHTGLGTDTAGASTDTPA